MPESFSADSFDAYTAIHPHNFDQLIEQTSPGVAKILALEVGSYGDARAVLIRSKRYLIVEDCRISPSVGVPTL